jgi:glycosyltransferase involved in cell wall biosynthesis
VAQLRRWNGAGGRLRGRRDLEDLDGSQRQFLGERDDVASLLAASDVFVLATSFEMLPISILEAMRAGLPVIASRVGGVGELVVHGETGLLVPGGSVAALTDALKNVLENFDLRRNFGRAARQR